MIDANHDVEQFCRTINASMHLPGPDRRAALISVTLPTGYHAICLRYADEIEPVAFLFSDNGTQSAAPVATIMALKGSKCAKLGVCYRDHETGREIIELVIDDGRRSDSKYLLGRPDSDNPYSMGRR